MKHRFIIFLFIILMVPLVAAQTIEFFVEQGEPFDIKINCVKFGNICSTGAFMNITIVYPNSSILIDNTPMSNLGNGFFNITLNENQTTPSGEYTVRATATDSGFNDTTTFLYAVNPDGIRPSDQKTVAIGRGVWSMLGIAVLLFVAFLFVNTTLPIKLTFFIISVMFFLIGINLIFVSLRGAVVDPALTSFFDSFTAITFILYWFGFAFIAILWIFTFLNTWLHERNMRNMRRFGGG